jgi:hypothetical protein
MWARFLYRMQASPTESASAMGVQTWIRIWHYRQLLIGNGLATQGFRWACVGI